jgi:hypothetical protein
MSPLLRVERLADHGAEQLSAGHAVLGSEAVDAGGCGRVDVGS